MLRADHNFNVRSDAEESSISEDFSVDDCSVSEGSTGGDVTNRHAHHSSEDESSSNNTHSEPLSNPVLTRIHDLLKRVRGFVSLVAKSSRIHEYIRQKRKENKLPGQVSRKRN